MDIIKGFGNEYKTISPVTFTSTLSLGSEIRIASSNRILGLEKIQHKGARTSLSDLYNFRFVFTVQSVVAHCSFRNGRTNNGVFVPLKNRSLEFACRSRYDGINLFSKTTICRFPIPSFSFSVDISDRFLLKPSKKFELYVAFDSIPLSGINNKIESTNFVVFDTCFYYQATAFPKKKIIQYFGG